MTPQEQIAYLRDVGDWSEYNYAVRDAVCDLAECGLLTDDETEAVRRYIAMEQNSRHTYLVEAVLRRLLGETP